MREPSSPRMLSIIASLSEYSTEAKRERLKDSVFHPSLPRLYLAQSTASIYEALSTGPLLNTLDKSFAMSNALNVNDIEQSAGSVKRGELVRQTSPELSGKDRRHLRSLGHHLHPVVQVGQRGIFDDLTTAIEQALHTHELIKIKVSDNCPRDINTVALWIHKSTDAMIIQIIGNTMLAYKPRKKNPDIKLPRRKQAQG